MCKSGNIMYICLLLQTCQQEQFQPAFQTLCLAVKSWSELPWKLHEFVDLCDILTLVTVKDSRYNSRILVGTTDTKNKSQEPIHILLYWNTVN